VISRFGRGPYGRAMPDLSRLLTLSTVLDLQRSAGNQAVARLLAEAAQPPQPR
jgi:hypothetical protein